MGYNSIKNSQIKILKPHAHLHIIGRMSKKFQMNQMKDVGGVAETRTWLAKFKSARATTIPSKKSLIKILKPHAHLHIGRKSTKFQVNPMKDVGGVAETRSLRGPAGRLEGWTE